MDRGSQKIVFSNRKQQKNQGGSKIAGEVIRAEAYKKAKHSNSASRSLRSAKCRARAQERVQDAVRSAVIALATIATRQLSTQNQAPPHCLHVSVTPSTAESETEKRK